MIKSVSSTRLQINPSIRFYVRQGSLITTFLAWRASRQTLLPREFVR